jgi:hypothetical protein
MTFLPHLPMRTQVETTLTIMISYLQEISTTAMLLASVLDLPQGYFVDILSSLSLACVRRGKRPLSSLQNLPYHTDNVISLLVHTA